MSEAEGVQDQEGEGAPQSAPAAWFFCLRLLGGRYAFAAPLVTEVVRLGPLTRLPAAPAFLPGVFTHRGEVLPVLDVGPLVGHGATPIRPSTRAAIVRFGEWKVAMVSDGLEGLVSLPAGVIEPPPAESGGMAEFLSGVGRDRHGVVAILDLLRLVESARSRAIPDRSAGP
jgi:purine-binding chemotaxis protein CheW